MAKSKKKGLPEMLSRSELIEKINELLDKADYKTVYLTYAFLDCDEDEEQQP